MPKEKEIKEKIIEMIEGFNSDKEMGIGGNLIDKFANEILELITQQKQKWAEESKRIKYYDRKAMKLKSKTTKT